MNNTNNINKLTRSKVAENPQLASQLVPAQDIAFRRSTKIQHLPTRNTNFTQENNITSTPQPSTSQNTQNRTEKFIQQLINFSPDKSKDTVTPHNTPTNITLHLQTNDYENLPKQEQTFSNPLTPIADLNIRGVRSHLDSFFDKSENSYTEIEGILDQQSIITGAAETTQIQIHKNETLKMAQRKLKMPLSEVASFVPEFNGINIPTAEYISKLRQAKNIIAAEDESSLTNLLKIKLRGEPYDALNNTPLDSIDALIKAIKQLYPIKDNIYILYGKLCQINQQPNERVVTFANRIKGLVLQIKELKRAENVEADDIEAYEALVDREALNSFKKGVNFKIKVQLGQNNTLEQTLLEAIKIEGTLEEQKLEPVGSQFNLKQENGLDNYNKKTSLCQICHDFRHEALFCNIAACIYCKKSDHCSNNCNNVTKKIQLICRYCNQAGHSKDTCPFNRDAISYCQYCQENNHKVNNCPLIINYEQCWRCKETGHNPNNCTTISNSIEKNQTKTNTRQINVIEQFCSLCQSQGHEFSECEHLKLLVTQFKERSSLKCQLCDDTGHIAKNCFKFQTSKQNFGNHKNDKTTQNQTIICNYCKKPGHIIPDCEVLKLKKRNENKYCQFCKKQGHVMEECYTLKTLHSLGINLNQNDSNKTANQHTAENY